MNIKMMLISALTIGTIGAASAQTISHWVDRQVHGTARHVTPRHHKPGEPDYAYRSWGYSHSYGMSRRHHKHYYRHPGY